MSRRIEALAARRENLLARSETLRVELREDAAAIAHRLSAGNRLVALARSGPVRLLLAAAAALLLFGRRRLVFKTAAKLWMLYPALRLIAPKLIAYRQRRSAARGVNRRL
jgi:hypothetical protein